MRERVGRLEQPIAEAVKLASPALQQVINDLQALRGIADISAVTIAAELSQVSRFDTARQLMGYCDHLFHHPTMQNQGFTGGGFLIG